MRNDFQIKKGLTSPKDNPIPFHQLTYKSYDELTKKLYCDIIRVHHKYPNDNITLLARKNKDLKALTSSYGVFGSIKFFTNGIGQELRLKSHEISRLSSRIPIYTKNSMHGMIQILPSMPWLSISPRV